MNESPEEIELLQALLDTSAASSGAHLRSAFGQDNRLTAHELVRRLDGIVEVHLAALAASGAPLVAPVDAILFRGRLWVGFPEAALRSKLLRQDPRVSASLVRDDLAFIIHGTFVAVGTNESSEFRAVSRSLYVAAYGDWMGDYLDTKQGADNDDLTGYIEPRVMFTKSA